MTNGDPSGTKAAERRAFWLCLVGVTLFVVALNSVNVLTFMADNPGDDATGVVIGEATSAVSGLAMIWLPWLAVRRVPLNRRPWWRTLAIHAAVLVLFSLAHVAGFVLLRQLIWAALGETYDFGNWLERWPYEFRKDAVSYSIIMLAFWLVRERIVAAAVPSPASEPATFDIRDGARIVRANLSDILAVSSAGNYAEFHLADGRKPLMRASLASLEARLGAQGFVRTHRSWLVNAARVTELKPEGSGDYAVTLGGVTAPLSRRFPEALARLRGG
ncbi:LytTR family DNA-binding domain-containing protein [Caulobacter sp. NIBR1757]|uniref:LytTR family DNA-binding domain-containing protein n=1 Tax=Caulobacter sp. NIBR1757 TaxID=3016000 RepID=UPI0022F02B1D|nr:LytTR family DNA-binding domain-containing protein [Caulobacter sp. NIBR1757]WGM39930.1 hypothetical protein AMEJIAPC_02870 [Caulobacter sp. NIBR1757]